jgi:hypothetical protein
MSDFWTSYRNISGKLKKCAILVDTTKEKERERGREMEEGKEVRCSLGGGL